MILKILLKSFQIIFSQKESNTFFTKVILKYVLRAWIINVCLFQGRICRLTERWGVKVVLGKKTTVVQKSSRSKDASGWLYRFMWKEISVKSSHFLARDVCFKQIKHNTFEISWQRCTKTYLLRNTQRKLDFWIEKFSGLLIPFSHP